jgi:hypothetical protein
LDSKFSGSNKPNIADVNNLQTVLNTKLDNTYKPTINDVIGLSNQLSSLFGLGNLPTIGQITGLQGALDLKFSSFNLPTIGNVQGLQTSLDGKFSSINPPQISNIPNLSQSLANAFSPSNLPSISNVQGLSDSLASKFSTSNQPNIGNVNGLQSLLDSKFSAGNPPSVSSILGLDALLGLGGASSGNLSNYYNKSAIDAKFDVVYANDLSLADRADQKYEFFSVAGNENNQRVLNIGSIVYPRSLLSEAKMVNIKICFSQDRDFDNDFYLLIMFKFSGFPVGFYSMVNGTITYLYGSCKYFIFGEGKSSNTPEFIYYSSI